MRQTLFNRAPLLLISFGNSTGDVVEKYSKTAVITGITGQDGLISTNLLISRGWNIVGVTRNLKHPRVLELRGLYPNIHFVELGNSSDFFTALVKEYKPNLFLHWGSPSSVSNPWEEPTNTLNDLIMSCSYILQAVISNGDEAPALMLPISSEIFQKDGFGKTPSSSRALNSIYAIGKNTMLDLAELYREKYDVQIFSPILFPHESPLRSGDFFSQRVMDAIIGARKDPDFKTSIGDLDAKRDWSWAPSVVSFIVDELEKGTSETITVGSGALYSTSEIIENFFSAAGIQEWRNCFNVDLNLVRKEGSLGNFALMGKGKQFSQPDLSEWSRMYVESVLSGKFLGLTTARQ